MATNFLLSLPELAFVDRPRKIICENDFFQGFILTSSPTGVMLFNPLSEKYEFHDNEGSMDTSFDEYDNLVEFIKTNFPDIKMYKYE